jgi:hypothetical protein
MSAATPRGSRGRQIALIVKSNLSILIPMSGGYAPRVAAVVRPR